jgi:hypothetical protein
MYLLFFIGVMSVATTAVLFSIADASAVPNSNLKYDPTFDSVIISL